MANLDTLSAIFTSAAQAAGASLSSSGRNLSGDVQNFVVPELRHLADQIILIQSRTGPGGLSADTAKHLIASHVGHAITLISAVATELLLTEVQGIINAALQAAADVVNGAFGFKVF